jgi:hypothetical protein
LAAAVAHSPSCLSNTAPGGQVQKPACSKAMGACLRFLFVCYTNNIIEGSAHGEGRP